MRTVTKPNTLRAAKMATRFVVIAARSYASSDSFGYSLDTLIKFKIRADWPKPIDANSYFHFTKPMTGQFTKRPSVPTVAPIALGW